jgi:DNA helicase-2/ATP-dependent DNA helicase PcrA
LKLIRLLRPDLKVYKLKALLAELGLQGENSHLADDDVNATVSLVNYCYTKGIEDEAHTRGVPPTT